MALFLPSINSAKRGRVRSLCTVLLPIYQESLVLLFCSRNFDPKIPALIVRTKLLYRGIAIPIAVAELEDLDSQMRACMHAFNEWLLSFVNIFAFWNGYIESLFNCCTIATVSRRNSTKPSVLSLIHI